MSSMTTPITQSAVPQNSEWALNPTAAQTVWTTPELAKRILDHTWTNVFVRDHSKSRYSFNPGSDSDSDPDSRFFNFDMRETESPNTIRINRVCFAISAKKLYGCSHYEDRHRRRYKCTLWEFLESRGATHERMEFYRSLEITRAERRIVSLPGSPPTIEFSALSGLVTKLIEQHPDSRWIDIKLPNGFAGRVRLERDPITGRWVEMEFDHAIHPRQYNLPDGVGLHQAIADNLPKVDVDDICHLVKFETDCEDESGASMWPIISPVGTAYPKLKEVDIGVWLDFDTKTSALGNMPSLMKARLLCKAMRDGEPIHLANLDVIGISCPELIELYVEFFGPDSYDFEDGDVATPASFALIPTLDSLYRLCPNLAVVTLPLRLPVSRCRPRGHRDVPTSVCEGIICFCAPAFHLDHPVRWPGLESFTIRYNPYSEMYGLPSPLDAARLLMRCLSTEREVTLRSETVSDRATLKRADNWGRDVREAREFAIAAQRQASRSYIDQGKEFAMLESERRTVGWRHEGPA